MRPADDLQGSQEETTHHLPAHTAAAKDPCSRPGTSKVPPTGPGKARCEAMAPNMPQRGQANTQDTEKPHNRPRGPRRVTARKALDVMATKQQQSASERATTPSTRGGECDIFFLHNWHTGFMWVSHSSTHTGVALSLQRP